MRFKFLIVSGFLFCTFLSFGDIVQTQLNLISCENQAFEEGDSIKEINKMLSLCLKEVFADKKSLCQLSVQYQHDYSTMQNIHGKKRINDYIFENSSKKNLISKCLTSRRKKEDAQQNKLKQFFSFPVNSGAFLDFQKNKIKTLALCMREDTYIEKIEKFKIYLTDSSVKLLSSCMVEIGSSQEYLNMKYNDLKLKLIKKKIENKSQIFFKKICTIYKKTENYDWCLETMKFFIDMKIENKSQIFFKKICTMYEKTENYDWCLETMKFFIDMKDKTNDLWHEICLVEDESKTYNWCEEAVESIEQIQKDLERE